MLNTQLMEALIKHRAEVKKALPTAFQVRVIDFVKAYGPSYGNTVADEFKINTDSAYALLKQAYNKGYLTRESIITPGRGRKYIYSYAL